MNTRDLLNTLKNAMELLERASSDIWSGERDEKLATEIDNFLDMAEQEIEGE